MRLAAARAIADHAEPGEVVPSPLGPRVHHAVREAVAAAARAEGLAGTARLAVTTRGDLVNHAKYPAVHWFSFFGLRRELLARGMSDAWDRFDIMDLDSKSGLSKAVVGAVRAIYPLRVLAHVATPYTVVVAVK